MELTGLLPLTRQLSGYAAVRERLQARARPEGRAAVVLEEAKPVLAASLAGDAAPVVLVATPRANRATWFHEQLQAWLGAEGTVLLLPEPDVLPHEQMDPDWRITQQRLRVLHTLASWRPSSGPVVVVGSVHALATRTVPAERFREATGTLRTGEKLRFETVASQWVRLGYQRVETVQQPGQFARRGGIIDCFPPHMDEPFRLDLFGDVIDNIRTFDPATQRSTSLLESVAVPPAREVIPEEEVRKLGSQEAGRHGRNSGTAEQRTAGKGVGSRLESVGARAAAAPAERISEERGYWFYAPLFNSGLVMEYLPKGSLVLLDEPSDLQHGLEEYHHRARSVREDLVQREELPADFPEGLATWPELIRVCEGAGALLSLHRWGGDDDEAIGFNPAPAFSGRLKEAMAEIRRSARGGRRVVVVSHQAQRLAELLDEAGVVAEPMDRVDVAPAPGSVTLVHGGLAGGWMASIPDAGEDTLMVLTDAELFGFVKQSRPLRARRNRAQENPLQGLAPGDLVVHVEHGIGRFLENVTMEEQPGVRKEYLLLEYAEGGRLYVPADQIDRVTRYVGQGGHQPALSQLGSQEWERAKTRVRKAAEEAAKELIETAAARQVASGARCGPDTIWQQELEASFPYVETTDQLQAVHDVKQDMQSERPMDRLVCGDVGYGKTEVAIRAAFKAVQEGMQVAVLVPTTVLAQQHCLTFAQRLSAFPVKVAALSRFQSPQEQRQVLQGLRQGTVDIVVGTHRLLQKDVEFQNLGLVVVDEEQRFGVMHKEYFKRLRRSVDVLTLSATPIPRTLYMAMVGVRDMSMMETPPEERLPIKTYVMEYDKGTIRQAILRELERGGQVFFVHNRVQTIARVAHELRELVPEATFGVGHGQMPEEALERVMVEFSEGRCDVLVCSTIIESGLDLPNVNTIIINDADKLGLAQLYQLRGRVGRGTNRAYAYLLFTRNKALTEKAEKRLQAVFEATDLGAGYYIAMKDLEIRGAGNLLGVEQSGHIGAVGFDLYCRILASAVEDAKAEQAGLPAPSRLPQPPAATIDLRLAAYLPDDYVPDLDTRLDIYRRLAAAISLDVVEEAGQELHDRFGPLPPQVEALLFSVRVKLLATQAGAESVTRAGDQVVVQLFEGLLVDAGPLKGLRGVQPGTSQVRIDASGRGNAWWARTEEALARMRR